MKTREEIFEGMKALADEAVSQGITVVVASRFPDGQFALVHCGYLIDIFGLCETIKYDAYTVEQKKKAQND